MKIVAFTIILAVLYTPINSSAQSSKSESNEVPVELARENKFVVKIMSVFNRSGKKISGIIDLDSFNGEKKVFVFKTGKDNRRRIPDVDIQKISIARIRQGVLTGKSPKLRVIAWNGATKIINLAYGEVEIKDGYLYLGRNEYAKHFDDSDMLGAKSHEWSDKLNQYWAKVKRESPEVFSTDFTYQDGRGSMSRKMAAAYCRSCVKIEILNIQITPATESIKLRCKEVFYDRWEE